MNQRNTQLLLAIGLILLAVTARIANAQMHIYHLAPVAALGLFCGAVIKDKRYAFLFTLLAQLLSDTYLQLFTSVPGFYGVGQLFVYAGMVAATFLGTFMGKASAPRLAAFSMGASFSFWLISNLGVWVGIELGGDLFGYGRGLTGLATTYLMALPFYTPMGTSLFFNALLGDLLFSGLLFGAFFALQGRLSAAPIAASASSHRS
jgi:hypothetical protein